MIKICKHSVEINDDNIDICHAIIIIIAICIILAPFKEVKEILI